MQPLDLRQQITEYLAYLRSERGSSENTVAAYRRDLRQWISASADLSPDGVERYLARLRSERLSDASIARKRASLSSFCRYLVGESALAVNPVALVEGVTRPAFRLPHVLSKTQVARLLNAPSAKTDRGKRDRALMALMYASGLRVSEVATLRAGEVDLGKGFLRVRGKGGKERLVPVSE
ncbi:MAG: site-specific integrase, partial [Cytophagales bacterium]|nr:site-specific integrase [Armatimonadota bacterium]